MNPFFKISNVSCENTDQSDIQMMLIDPKLGGSFAVEAKELYEREEAELMVFVPADPMNSFTTVCGIQRWNHVAICKTELAINPHCPILEDDMVKILEEEFDSPIHLIKLPRLRSSENLFQKSGIYICDAENQEDLIRIAKEIRKNKRKTLVIGTKGIAETLHNL